MVEIEVMNAEPWEQKSHKIHFIVNFYNDSDPERAEELCFSLKKNLENPWIDRVHLLLEDFTVLPKEFEGHPKMIVQRIGPDRLTFKYALTYAQHCKEIAPLDALVLSNSDIFMCKESPWGDIFEVFATKPGKVTFNLSRHEINKEGDVWFENCMSGYSQDVWVYQKMPAPIPIVPESCLVRMEYCVGGAPQCDGYSNYLMKNVGLFDVYNWSLKFKVYHYDRCRGHSFGVMILNAKTDNRAHDAVQGNPFISERGLTCPFVNYQDYIDNGKTKNFLYPLNHVTMCAKEFTHSHALNNHLVVNTEEIHADIKRILWGICAPSITQKERFNTLRGIASEMLYRVHYFDYVEYFEQQFLARNPDYFSPETIKKRMEKAYAKRVALLAALDARTDLTDQQKEEEKMKRLSSIHEKCYTNIKDMLADAPDAAAMFSEWAWKLQDTQGQRHNAFRCIMRSLQFNLNEECYKANYYTYKRYHYMGVICYYLGDFENGYLAVTRAITENNHAVDKTNFSFYPQSNIHVH